MTTDPRWDDDTERELLDAMTEALRLDHGVTVLTSEHWDDLCTITDMVRPVLRHLADHGLLVSPAEREVLDAARELDREWQKTDDYDAPFIRAAMRFHAAVDALEDRP